VFKGSIFVYALGVMLFALCFPAEAQQAKKVDACDPTTGVSHTGSEAPVEVIAGNSANIALKTLIPKWEAATGIDVHETIMSTGGMAAAISTRHLSSDPNDDVDVLIAPTTTTDQVTNPAACPNCGLTVENRYTVGFIPIVLIVQAGRPIPDVSTIEKLRDVFYAANCITGPARTTSTGVFITNLFNSQGWAADLDPKFFSYSTLTNGVLDAVVKVADGTCDVGVTSLISAIIEPSVSWTSLPVQDLIIYQTSVASDASNTKDRCYARAFQDFINAPEQQHDWVAGGFLPAN